MIKYSMVTYLMFFLICSCSVPTNRDDNFINEDLKDVPLELKDIFPKKDSRIFYVHAELTVNKRYVYYIYYDFDLTADKEILLDSLIRGKESFSTNDSVFVIKKTESLSERVLEGKHMIPFFEDDTSDNLKDLHVNNIFDKSTKSGLKNDFIFYDMGSKNWDLIDDDSLKEYIISLGKHNGYIKGIALFKEDKTLIYYFVIF